MKQYLSSEQTAKLIELGFEKPKSYHDIEWDGTEAYDYQLDYSIGELIEMLDKVGVTTSIRFGGARAISLSNNKGREMLGGQLIDLLFVMIIELKEEGVI